MAMPTPSTSHEKDSSSENENVLLDDYGKETYTLLKYVVHELAMDIKKYRKKEYPLQRAHRLTGLQISTLEKLAYKKDSITIDNISEINRKHVHDALISFYLDVKLVPTLTDLFYSLQHSLPQYEDIRSFRRKVVKMGYIFRKKPNAFVIYEKPSIRFERFLYLKQIVKYREDKRHIYYLSELAVPYYKLSNINEKMLNSSKDHYFFYFAVSSVTGVQFVTKVSLFDSTSFNGWVLADVIPNLEFGSVVILDNAKYHCDKYCEPPKRTSPKHIMTEWLTFHEIPFKTTMNTFELFTLVEKFTDLLAKTHKVDIWLKHNNHDVLRLPDCINELTPAAQVRNIVSEKLKSDEIPLTKSLKDIVCEIGLADLESFNTSLTMEETRLLNTELKVDKVLDHIKPSCTAEKDLYLPSFSDSE